jgi:Zinc dependent phospholipase C
MRPSLLRPCAALLVAATILLSAPRSPAYSVLTHEQVIDLVWKQHLKPLLQQRYPRATEEDLRQAHAYAYGGCLIQDMGYYPFGNKFFTDLTHYVRSGEFVAALIENAQDLNELAFALGALAHYASDITGHPTVNASVAREFPNLAKKYGREVTYVESPSAHIRTEFGFDVLQVAKQQYSSQAYHDFIGFQVAQPLLERTFPQIYGLQLKEIFPQEDRTIGSYRRSVSKFIPELTRVALVSKKDELQALPNFSPKKFRYLLSRTEYERNWGKNYERPGCGAKFLAFIVRLMPKIGPFRTLDIKPPTPETEKMYIKSVEDTVTFYDKLLTAFETHQLDLPNRNYDTGNPTAAGEYALADKTYARLLRTLVKNNFVGMSPDLRANILLFYSDLSKPIDTKRHKKEWKETVSDLKQLKAQPAQTK